MPRYRIRFDDGETGKKAYSFMMDLDSDSESDGSSYESSSSSSSSASSMSSTRRSEEENENLDTQQRLGLGLLHSIPPEVTTNILTFSSIPTRINLASCSRTLLHIIYHLHPTHWSELDFERLPRRYSCRLTDAMLHRLLVRINACEVTRIISLRNCVRVTGVGLEPLRGSRMLEQIDLRVGYDHPETFGPTGLNEKVVLDILTSMLPKSRSSTSKKIDVSNINIDCNNKNKVTSNPMSLSSSSSFSSCSISSTATPTTSSSLALIKFRRQRSCYNYYDSFDSKLRSFLVRFDALTKAKIRKTRTKCSCCTNALVDAIPEADFDWAAVAALCDTCKRRTCQQQDCPVTAICSLCMGRFCDDCRLTSYCDRCREFFCEECRCVGECGSCRKSFCEGCKTLPFCHMCQSAFCDDGCLLVDYCERCEITFCQNCRAVSFCGGCKRYLCSTCLPQCHHDSASMDVRPRLQPSIVDLGIAISPSRDQYSFDLKNPSSTSQRHNAQENVATKPTATAMSDCECRDGPSTTDVELNQDDPHQATSALVSDNDTPMKDVFQEQEQQPLKQPPPSYPYPTSIFRNLPRPTSPSKLWGRLSPLSGLQHRRPGAPLSPSSPSLSHRTKQQRVTSPPTTSTCSTGSVNQDHQISETSSRQENSQQGHHPPAAETPQQPPLQQQQQQQRPVVYNHPNLWGKITPVAHFLLHPDRPLPPPTPPTPPSPPPPSPDANATTSSVFPS